MPFVTQAATFHLCENKVVGTMAELTSQNKLNKFTILTAASYSFPTFYLFNAQDYLMVTSTLNVCL